MSLFEAAGLEEDVGRPLADRLRPVTLADVVGQDHLLADGRPLARMAASRRLASMILWGPPGSGKTTIARLLAQASGLEFVQLSAIHSGVADLKKIFAVAKAARQAGRGTLLFIDEIHRFNRAQQDSFLPHVEDGTVVLIGATTENPSFELNSALLSRAQVFVLNRLDEHALAELLARAEAHLARPLALAPDARDSLIDMADGDGRFLLNLAEAIDDARLASPLARADLAAFLSKRAPQYDKSREEHYNLISALHKSVRGSDPDATLYWMQRMLQGGEDPLYLARRLVRMAVEDIGLADPHALLVANAAREAYQHLGSPEGELALGQAAVYLATAAKSNAVYKAFKEAGASAQASGSLAPPAHILNAPTGLMRELGYGAGYQYDHDTEEAHSGQDYFPPDMKGRPEFYRPTERGQERDIKARLDHWRKRKQGAPKPSKP